LRFPGFEGEWEKKKLGEIGEVRMCRRIFNDETSLIDDVPFFKIGSFGKEADAFISKELFLDYKKRFSFPRKGDILISAAGTIGRTVVYNGEDAYFQDSNIVWIDNDNTSIINDFLYYVLQIVKYNTEGGTIQRLYNNTLRSTEFNAPSIPEQRKIALALSHIYKRIQAQNKIIEELELLKNLLIKKSINRELRFSEFTDDWNTMTLGEVCEKQASNISANKIEVNFGDYAIYGASGELKKVDFYEVENDYIGIVKDGAGAGRLFYCEGRSSVLGTLDIIKPNKNVDTYFLYCLLSCIDFSKYSSGSTIPHIYFKDYANEKVKVPATGEQIKIANFLSTIDQKIQTEKAIQERFETQKKVLLLQLLV